jgi:hypothetical protein
LPLSLPINEGPCLLSGTHVMTSDGATCVENLSLGAMVLTASGESRPVRWLGHRELDCSRHRDPASVWPICIKAGAFADSQPSRDLWVSPGHSIYVDGILIQAEKLVNGATIVRVPRAQVKYWHVELDSHDVLLTEGLPTESYLDTGNRTSFANGGDFVEAHPDFRPKHWAETCAPLVLDGPAVQSAKERLLARAHSLGHAITEEADVHLWVDGRRIDPLQLSATRLAFTLPAASTAVELRSRHFVPAHMVPASEDWRVLGLCIHSLQLDGAGVALDDEAVFAQGWCKLESDDNGQQWRWTSGRAMLPAGSRLIVVDISGGLYWLDPPVELIAQSV